MKYIELKRRQENEISNFEGIFFAFSAQQVIDGMHKVGLKPDEKEKIVSIGCGCFVLKEKKSQLIELFDQHQKEIKAIKEDKKLLLDALSYELANHEYCITGRASDALDVLGLKAEDVPEDIFKQARMSAMADC